VIHSRFGYRRENRGGYLGALAAVFNEHHYDHAARLALRKAGKPSVRELITAKLGRAGLAADD
jgi:hypothetical protein